MEEVLSSRSVVEAQKCQSSIAPKLIYHSWRWRLTTTGSSATSDESRLGQRMMMLIRSCIQLGSQLPLPLAVYGV